MASTGFTAIEPHSTHVHSVDESCFSNRPCATSKNNPRNQMPISNRRAFHFLLQVRDVHDLLTNWNDEADLLAFRLCCECGSLRRVPSQNTDGSASAHLRDRGYPRCGAASLTLPQSNETRILLHTSHAVKITDSRLMQCTTAFGVIEITTFGSIGTPLKIWLRLAWARREDL